MGRRGKVHDTEDGAWQWLRQENAKKTLGISDPADMPSATVSELIEVRMASLGLSLAVGHGC